MNFITSYFVHPRQYSRIRQTFNRQFAYSGGVGKKDLTWSFLSGVPEVDPPEGIFFSDSLR